MIMKDRVGESESSQYFFSRVVRVLTAIYPTQMTGEKRRQVLRLHCGAWKRKKLKFNAVSDIWYKSTTIARPCCDGVSKHDGVGIEEEWGGEWRVQEVNNA